MLDFGSGIDQTPYTDVEPPDSVPSMLFNVVSHPSKNFHDINEKVKAALAILKDAAGQLTFEQLTEIQQGVEEARLLVLETKIEVHQVERMLDRAQLINDEDAPTIGQDFAAAVRRANCNIVINHSIKEPEYCGHSYGARNFGFANEVAFNPEHSCSDERFDSAASHEFFHAFEEDATPSSQYNPWNPYTRTILHPEDYALLMEACERDANAMQGGINYLRAKNNKAVYDATANDIVSAADFAAIRKESGSFAEALTAAALSSLSKPLKRSDPNGRTFVNSYQEMAIRNFENAMKRREAEGESGWTFVRLEPTDIWHMGNYGVGPNCFGEREMDMRFMTRHPLEPAAQKRMDALKDKYRIPPLVACPTIRQYTENLPQTTRQAQSQNFDL